MEFIAEELDIPVFNINCFYFANINCVESPVIFSSHIFYANFR